MKCSTQDLIKKAIEARERAYAPYSKYKVGAAVLTESGKIFTGANVENSSYGLTMCAERTAIFNAVSRGFKNFTAVAAVAERKNLSGICGACRQVIYEFGNDIDVIVANENGEYRVNKISELLNFGFRLE